MNSSRLRPNASLRYDAIRRALKKAKYEPARILEIGCGQGNLSVALAERSEYVGIEPDATSFAVAASRVATLGRGEVRCIDYQTLDQDDRFDLVCAFEVLEHISNDAETLGRWKRFVSPGGFLMVTVPGYQHRFSVYDEYVGHFRRYEPESLAALFRAQGLEDVTVMHYGFPLSYLVEYAHTMLARRRTRLRPSAMNMEQKTAASGRVLRMPDAAIFGAAILTKPFCLMQRWFPHRGPGLLAYGRVADEFGD